MQKEESRLNSETLFEGMISVRSVIEAWQSGIGDRRIEALYYDEARSKKEAGELAWLKHRGEEMGFDIVLTDRKTLDDMAIGSSHGGVIARAGARTIPPLSQEAILPCGFYVMMDGIEDPYNFGYALRTLYAMGADGVILTPRNWMSAAGVVCRASAGASERLPMFVCSDLEALSMFESVGYRTVAADLRDSIPSHQADLKKPLFLLVGGEKRGISRAALDRCQMRVRIEYGRSFGRSLSAASAATVLGYEIFRQNLIDG